MKNYKFIILLLLFAANIFAGARAIHLYDIWTGQPVAGALVYTANDTLISNFNGYVDLKGKSDSIIIDARNYFKENVNIAELDKPLVYLEPYDYTEAITVVRSAEPDSRLSIPTHISHINLHMTDSFQPAAKLLDAQSGITMKSYGGYGQIQTISLRGMSAAQTQTLLDGIPMNNLQMGNLNFSSVSVNALQGIDIYRGGNYMFGGSGAIGGVINLQTVKPQEYLNYNLFYQNASWNNNLFYGRVDLPLGVIKQSIFFEQASGENNYSVKDGDKEVMLQNRDYSGYHLNYKGQIPLSEKSHLELFMSSYKNDAGAPMAYIDENSERANRAGISNNNTLSRLKFKQYSRKGAWSIQGFVRNSWMEYNNPTLIIDGKALHSTHFNSEKGAQLRWNNLFAQKFLVQSGVDGSRQFVNSSEAGIHERDHFSLYTVADWLIAEHCWYFHSLHFNVGARYESYSDFGNVFLPGVSLSAAVKKITFYVSGGKNYRAPAFNDLYWQPGGNSGLNAERSINYEFGADYQQTFTSYIVSLNSSFYMNDVSQQIKWLPGDLYWQPQNIASVLSKGFEVQAEAQDINRIHKISFSYSYGSAVKNSREFSGDNTMGNQLPFIPKEKWALNVGSGLWKFHYGLRAAWNSFRYTTMENKDFLPSYYLFDIYTAMRISLWRQQIEISFTLNNFLDTPYEVMNGYPMPPRNYQLSLRFSGRP